MRVEIQHKKIFAVMLKIQKPRHVNVEVFLVINQKNRVILFV